MSSGISHQSTIKEVQQILQRLNGIWAKILPQNVIKQATMSCITLNYPSNVMVNQHLLKQFELLQGYLLCDKHIDLHVAISSALTHHLLIFFSFSPSDVPKDLLSLAFLLFERMLLVYRDNGVVLFHNGVLQIMLRIFNVYEQLPIEHMIAALLYAKMVVLIDRHHAYSLFHVLKDFWSTSRFLHPTVAILDNQAKQLTVQTSRLVNTVVSFIYAVSTVETNPQHPQYDLHLSLLKASLLHILRFYSFYVVLDPNSYAKSPFLTTKYESHENVNHQMSWMRNTLQSLVNLWRHGNNHPSFFTDTPINNTMEFCHLLNRLTCFAAIRDESATNLLVTQILNEISCSPQKQHVLAMLASKAVPFCLSYLYYQFFYGPSFNMFTNETFTQLLQVVRHCCAKGHQAITMLNAHHFFDTFALLLRSNGIIIQWGGRCYNDVNETIISFFDDTKHFDAPFYLEFCICPTVCEIIYTFHQSIMYDCDVRDKCLWRIQQHPMFVLKQCGAMYQAVLKSYPRHPALLTSIILFINMCAASWARFNHVTVPEDNDEDDSDYVDEDDDDEDEDDEDDYDDEDGDDTMIDYCDVVDETIAESDYMGQSASPYSQLSQQSMLTTLKNFQPQWTFNKNYFLPFNVCGVGDPGIALSCVELQYASCLQRMVVSIDEYIDILLDGSLFVDGNHPFVNNYLASQQESSPTD